MIDKLLNHVFSSCLHALSKSNGKLWQSSKDPTNYCVASIPLSSIIIQDSSEQINYLIFINKDSVSVRIFSWSIDQHLSELT